MLLTAEYDRSWMRTPEGHLKRFWRCIKTVENIRLGASGAEQGERSELQLLVHFFF